MAQHDYVIDNQASAAARTDLNNLFQAIASQNSGATAPATTYANMIWYETDTNTLWKRNEANSGWISMGVFDESALIFTPSGSPVIATQAEAEAGSDNVKMMTSLRVAQAIPAKLNATGSAPLYACRAWVNFDGTGTLAVSASGNVTSVTDNGTGDYTVNFTNAMADANYSIVASANNVGVVGENSNNVLRTTTAARLRIVGSGGTTARDCSEVNVAVFR